MLVIVYRSTRCNIPEDVNLQTESFLTCDMDVITNVCIETSDGNYHGNM
jgi:hypothetical protein